VPIEGLFRSLLLVLMDNGTAEYAFITRFFNAAAESAAPISPLLSPRSSIPDDNVGTGIGGFNFSGRTRAGSVIIDLPPPIATPNRTNTNKEQQGLLDGLWKQVLDPALDYCQVKSSIF
jgi:vacuolar protein sorting-associated protein 52